MPALQTQLALFWGHRAGTGRGQLSLEPGAQRLEGWVSRAAPGPWIPDLKASEGLIPLGLHLHLLSKCFLGTWGQIKRKHGGVGLGIPFFLHEASQG